MSNYFHPDRSIDYLRQRDRERIEQGIRCPIPGCRRVVSGVKHLCATHARRRDRFGSPTQKAIRKHQLAPYLNTVRRFVKANEDHPAITFVFTELSRWLSAGAAKAPTWTDKADTLGKLRFELGRLHRGGIGGREIFEVVAALHLMDHDAPNTFRPDGPTCFMQWPAPC